jgi:hypothetical protein
MASGDELTQADRVGNGGAEIVSIGGRTGWRRYQSGAGLCEPSGRAELR